jgi:hypothetical protein
MEGGKKRLSFVVRRFLTRQSARNSFVAFYQLSQSIEFFSNAPTRQNAEINKTGDCGETRNSAGNSFRVRNHRLIARGSEGQTEIPAKKTASLLHSTVMRRRVMMMTVQAGEGEPSYFEVAPDQNSVVAQSFQDIYARDFRGIDGNAFRVGSYQINLLNRSIYLQLLARLVLPNFHLHHFSLASKHFLNKHHGRAA